MVPRGEGEGDLRLREDRILRSVTSLAEPEEARLLANSRKELERFLGVAKESLVPVGEVGVAPTSPRREGKSEGAAGRVSVRLRGGESGGIRPRVSTAIGVV